MQSEIKKRPFVFIAFEDFDNLGIGYLRSVLEMSGHPTMLVNMRSSREEILNILRKCDPIITGFSIIYQYNINKFIELISFLRAEGINCHFTAGGNYASLRYSELFAMIPFLDSIVRFEGEETVKELAECISEGHIWTRIKGIAYKNGDEIISNPLRLPAPDLDLYPFPLRQPPKKYAFDRYYATLIAGRGCVHNCSFCNQNKFYRHPGWPQKRIRRPSEIVREMNMLHYERNCSVFLFEDDDFPLKDKNDLLWIEKFCEELKISGLSEKILWKINCRPDEIEEPTFRLMQENGLFLIFTGIEDGTENGLKNLGKNLSVERILSGIDTLKRLGIGFDYGFILFQPVTTFRSLNENLNFLDKICGDGYSPVSFLRMMPYYETRIEEDLKKQGRLLGDPGYYTYEFLERSMNEYYLFIADVFDEWFNDDNGLVNLLKWARNYISVCSRFIFSGTRVRDTSDNIKAITAKSNAFLLNSMREFSELFERNNLSIHNHHPGTFKETVSARHRQFKEEIIMEVRKLQLLACINQPGLLENIT